MSNDNELGILARRRIEAEIIKPVYEIMKREFGIERAQAVIGEAVSNAAIEAGRAFAAREKNGADIESFVALQHLWEKDDALQIEVLRSDPSAGARGRSQASRRRHEGDYGTVRMAGQTGAGMIA